MAATDVILNAIVVGWRYDEAGNIIGARVRVGAQAPDGAANFKAVVHATFQGYGIPRDPQLDMEN
jgi:hypothetical protein